MSMRMNLATYVARRVEVRRSGGLVDVIYSENLAGAIALKDVAAIRLTPDQARELARNLLLAADQESAS